MNNLAKRNETIFIWNHKHLAIATLHNHCYSNIAQSLLLVSWSSTKIGTTKCRPVLVYLNCHKNKSRVCSSNFLWWSTH